jgi:hypothetical protein
VDLAGYRETFLGQRFGIGLRQRSDKDYHVVMDFLVEAQFRWFQADRSSIDVAWLPDIANVFHEAQEWLTRCAESNGDGWQFRIKPRKKD